jgi:hypothetical protein
MLLYPATGADDLVRVRVTANNRAKAANRM